MTFDNYTGLYFYSSVFQGNMALLALVGVFAVFKIQMLQSSIQNSDVRIVEFVKRWYAHFGTSLPPDVEASFADVGSLDGRLQELLQKMTGLRGDQGVLVGLTSNKDYKELIQQRGKLAPEHDRFLQHMIPPVASILLVTVVSLVLLPYASAIHIASGTAEAWIIWATILLQCVALAANVMFVRKTLRA